MRQQDMVAPDHEQASLRHATSRTTRSWKADPPLWSHDDVLGSSTADVTCSGRERMATTGSYLENPAPHHAVTSTSNNKGGRLSAIVWCSSGMNSPTLQQQREHYMDRDSSSLQIESDSRSAGASSLLHQKDPQRIALNQSPMSSLFLVGDPNARSKNQQERSSSLGKFHQTVQGTIDHHVQDDGHTHILGHTSFVCDHSTGSHSQTSSIGQMYTTWVTSTAFVGPKTTSQLLTSLSQQQQQATMTGMNTTGTVRTGDSLSGRTKEVVQALDHMMTAAILDARETTLNQLGPGSDRNSMLPSRINNEVSHDGPPFVLKYYSPLQHVEHVQQACIKEGTPLRRPHVVPPRTSMMMLQRASSCDQVVPYIFKAMQSQHAQEQPIQEPALPHLCEESSDENPRGIFRHQGDKVGYLDKSASELDKSEHLFCHDNLAMYLDEDNNGMPRPFDPAIGRPQVIIPSSRSLATSLEEDTYRPLASKGTMKYRLDPEIEQSDKTVTFLFPERGSSYHVMNQFESQPLPLTWLPSCLQSIMPGRINHLSDLQQSSSHHVTDHVVSTRASKEYNDCGDEAASQLSRKQDSQTCSAFHAFPVSHGNNGDSSSIECRVPRNNESCAKRTLGRDHFIGNATRCNETPTMDRKNVAGDSISVNIEHNITRAKATKTATPAVKPLNAYNYFYSEMREGILQLSGAEMEMFILNNGKHDDNNHTHGYAGRNCTLYQPGLLANAILRKQNARFSKAERKRMLLSKHWNKDRTTRRRHRTKHGKMSFNHMNKIVSTEWNSLPEAQKIFYKEVAEADSKHYKEHESER